MIQPYTILDVIDNSGVKKVMCIRVLGAKQYAYVGDIIKVCTKHTNGKIKQGIVMNALVTNTCSIIKRDGLSIRASKNTVVLLNDTKDNVLATRIFGCITQEVLKKKYCFIKRLSSLSKNII